MTRANSSACGAADGAAHGRTARRCRGHRREGSVRRWHVAAVPAQSTDYRRRQEATAACTRPCGHARAARWTGPLVARVAWRAHPSLKAEQVECCRHLPRRFAGRPAYSLCHDGDVAAPTRPRRHANVLRMSRGHGLAMMRQTRLFMMRLSHHTALAPSARCACSMDAGAAMRPNPAAVSRCSCEPTAKRRAGTARQSERSRPQRISGRQPMRIDRRAGL